MNSSKKEFVLSELNAFTKKQTEGRNTNQITKTK